MVTLPPPSQEIPAGRTHVLYSGHPGLATPPNPGAVRQAANVDCGTVLRDGAGRLVLVSNHPATMAQRGCGMVCTR